MFGIVLGALGPVGWAVGGVVTAIGIAAAMSDDDDSSDNTQVDNKSEVKKKHQENQKN